MSTLRYAGYIRVSTEGQAQGYSLDSQKSEIKQLVEQRGGKYIRTYTDDGHSGRTIERPAFLKMLLDARHGRFDALVVLTWDRFGRSPINSLVVKFLLRKEYGIKIFAVRDQSADDISDELTGMLMEAVGDLSGEWFSRNVGRDIQKSLIEKHRQGYHNGNPPYGYRKEGADLVPDLENAEAVSLIFNWYASGQYSYREIVWMLRERDYKRRGKDFSVSAIREMLENRVYIGEVSYNVTRYKRGRKQKNGALIEWGTGRHQPLVSRDLFYKCLTLRLSRTHHKHRPPHRAYLLQGLLYCQRCVENPPQDLPRSWGKLYIHFHTDHEQIYCLCASDARGYAACGQHRVQTYGIERQVIACLMTLKHRPELCLRLGKEIAERIGERNIASQVERLLTIAEQVDTDYLRTDIEKYIAVWQTLTNGADYFPKVGNYRVEDIELATDMLYRFDRHWDAYDGEVKKQHDLISLLVERIFVYDTRATKIVFVSGQELALV